MNYGQIISDTFRLIWREKKLWLLGMIGLAISGLASGLYLSQYLNWYSHFLSDIVNMANSGAESPDEVFGAMMNSMSWLFGAGSLLMLGSLFGYILNIIMRGATISEAAKVWADENEHVDVGRGTRTGWSRGLKVFGIDVIWQLPGLVLGICGVAAGIFTFAGAMGTAFGGGDEEQMASTFLGMMGSIFAVIGCLACVVFLIMLVQGIFAPLMYQSAVQGKHGFGDALREGWRLARNNLGAMIVLFIVVIGVGVLAGILLQAVMIPLIGVWSMNWMQMFQALDQGAPIAPPSAGNTVLLLFGGLLVGLVMVLVNSFVQTFSLTMYAEVYRQLTVPEFPEIDVETVPELPQETMGG